MLKFLRKLIAFPFLVTGIATKIVMAALVFIALIMVTGNFYLANVLAGDGTLDLEMAEIYGLFRDIFK